MVRTGAMLILLALGGCYWADGSADAFWGRRPALYGYYGPPLQNPAYEPYPAYAGAYPPARTTSCTQVGGVLTCTTY